MRKRTLHLFGCQEYGSSSTILLALLCVFSHSIALNNEGSHDPPAGLDVMNLSGSNPMVIYLVSLFYAQMPQNSTRFFIFFPKYSFSFSTDISLICIKICTEQSVPDQICQILLLLWLVYSRKSGLEIVSPDLRDGPASAPRVGIVSFRDLLCEEIGEPTNASLCRGQDIGSGKCKPRSSCDTTFSKHLSCTFPSCMGKIIIFGLLYKVLGGLQDFY